MTILVPTDFSANASQAIEYATEICRATGSRLVLLHVCADKLSPIRQRLQAEETMAALIKTIADEYSEIACTSAIASGDVVEQILFQSDSLEADLIVMGTEGASNLGRLFFGSNTAAVIEKTTRTVLSIPAGTAFVRPERMLFCTNLTPAEKNAAIHFVNFAKAFDATVIIAHVSTEEDREEAEASLVEVFTSEIVRRSGYEKITSRLVGGNTPAMGIDALIADARADIIALSTRRRSLFEKMYNPSLTKKFSLQGEIPLFAFHCDP